MSGKYSAKSHYKKKSSPHNTPESADSVVALSGKNPQAGFSSDKSHSTEA